jgi:hypothetical protein
MHPDDIIAALRRELEGLNKNAEDYESRKAQIEKEIAFTDDMERPAVKPENPGVVIDHRPGYLAGLRRELETSTDDRHDEIAEEAERVEADLRINPSPQQPDVEPDAEPEDDGDEVAEEKAEPETDAGAEAADDELESKTRQELDEVARELGIEGPEKLANKAEVIGAIYEAEDAEPETDGVEEDGDEE